MKEVTGLLDRYRQCARGVWNDFLREAASPANEALARFDGVQRLLFQAIVLDPLGVRQYLRTDPDHPCSLLRIVPNAADVPILVERPQDEGEGWDAMEPGARDGMDLRYIGYFDWDERGRRPFLYFRVQVAGCAADPALTGRHALVEVDRARVFLDPEAPQGGGRDVA